MFLISQPARAQIEKFITSQCQLAVSYPEVGASRNGGPRGYCVIHHRVRLGSGAETFDRAVTALYGWKMYDMGWTRLCWPHIPIREGAVIAVLVHHFGFWSLNALRIIYTVSESGPVERRGFAVGTLPGHAERGEERFLVEWERASDEVWYEIWNFARPRHVLARLGGRAVRLLQRRFAEESGQAMMRSVQFPCD